MLLIQGNFGRLRGRTELQLPELRVSCSVGQESLGVDARVQYVFLQAIRVEQDKFYVLECLFM